MKPKAAAAAEPLMDLLSMDDDGSSSPKLGNPRGRAASTSSAAGLSSEVLAQVPTWLKAAALVRVPTTKAVLLKSDLLTITVSGDFRAHQARLAVFFDNTSNFDILNLKVTVACVASSAGAINVKQQDPSVRVSPGEETRLQLALESARPFSDAYPLEMDVKFTVSGSPYGYTLLLPVTAPSFFESLPTDKATYMGRWKSLDGTDAEAQQVFSSAKPVDATLLTHIRTVLVPSMRLGLAEGLDNERTVTGSASFLTGTVGPDGKPISVGVMMRLEGDPAQGKFRITARAKNALVAQAVKNFLVHQLS